MAGRLALIAGSGLGEFGGLCRVSGRLDRLGFFLAGGFSREGGGSGRGFLAFRIYFTYVLTTNSPRDRYLFL